MSDFTDLTDNRICIPVLLGSFPKRKLKDGVWKRVGVMDSTKETLWKKALQWLKSLPGA